MANQHILLDGLNSEQKKVVLHDKGPCLVLAGPGSGKTRALTHKISYLVLEKKVDADEILAVTFTNKAASEMKNRISELLKEANVKASSWIGTFHSICARILRIEASHLDVDNTFVVYDTDDSEKLVKEILSEIDLDSNDISPRAVLASISRAKGEMIDPISYANQTYGNFFFERVSKVYPIYQKKLRENNAMDFGDLLLETVKLFKKNQNVLEKYQKKFKYILVDEYQDTNRVQYFLVKQLSKKHKNLTVVGDISQSIYSWRGADYRNMLQFEKDYKGAKIYKLAENYRSTNVILDAAKSLIENNSSHIPIDLFTKNDLGSLITLFESDHERDEARYVIDTINFLTRETSVLEHMPEEKFNNFAVLYRTNAQSRVLEEAFITEGLPYKIVGGTRFYDRREIKDTLAYLKVFYNPKDKVSWARCINTPPRGIGPKSLKIISESKYDVSLIEKMTKVEWSKYIEMAKNKASVIDLLDCVLKDFGYLEYLNDGSEESLGRVENLQELRTVAMQYESLGQFLETVTLIEASNRPDKKNDNSVTLMTLHSAKGLEFDTVIITGMEEGLFPHSRSMADQNELEEERRLCYVGMTRAKKDLFLTYTRRRTYFGQTGSSIISRFISEIPEHLLDFKFG